jgi:hypothetical protein
VAIERSQVSKGSGHFPVLIKLHNGDLFGVIRAGDLHNGIKGRLETTRSTDRGRTWSQRLLFDSEMDDRNPVVGQLEDFTPFDRTITGTRGAIPFALRLMCNWAPRLMEKIVQLPSGVALLAAYFREAGYRT